MKALPHRLSQRMIEEVFLSPHFTEPEKNELVVAVENLVLATFWRGRLDPSENYSPRFANKLGEVLEVFMANRNYPEDMKVHLQEEPRIVSPWFGGKPAPIGSTEGEEAKGSGGGILLPPRRAPPSLGYLEWRAEMEQDEPPEGITQMRRLNETQAKDWEDIKDRVQEAEEALRGALQSLQERVQKEWEDVIEPMIQDINAATDTASEFIDGIKDKMDEYSEDRTDTWRESDNGEAFADWRAEWDVELPNLEIEEPGIPDLDDEGDLASEILEEISISVM